MLEQARSGGTPVDADAVSAVGAHLGADLSEVRLHAGPRAADLNAQMHAKAFTVGHDVFFRDGLPDASTPDGLELLAHELVHTVQQGASKPLHSPLDTVAAGRPGTARLQRSPESEALMAELIRPQVFEGPTVEVQQQLVAALEAELSQRDLVRTGPIDPYHVSCLGGIVLHQPQSDELDALIADAVLIPLERNDVRGPMDRSLDTDAFNVVQDANAERLIIENTLTTMETAGQLAYLRESGLLQDPEWQILIEIHYYRDRLITSRLLHKDTLGQTLFVNLNFINDQEIAGPEYVLNPDRGNDPRDLAASHPGVFLDDLDAALADTPAPDTIEATIVPANGVVAFVDEAIHHKTPLVGHRELRRDQLRSALQHQVPDDLDRAEAAYDDFANQKPRKKKLFGKKAKPFYEYLETDKKTAAAWERVVRALQNQKRFDRRDLEELFPPGGRIEVDIDRLLEVASEEFRGATVPGVEGKLPVQADPDAPTLTRRMSLLAREGQAPEQPSGKRQFFRTWVRAVRL
ncbi:MAG TPA: DUF4157 domain-containing protein [Egicoccus sp.]|nr:DUF4157 domain-containing protein [Egicoccus sp.]HSK23215.1 DUF4157 domain-containing protein [Egicoccus sp.]